MATMASPGHGVLGDLGALKILFNLKVHKHEIILNFFFT
jgi:hypothetical protein